MSGTTPKPKRSDADARQVRIAALGDLHYDGSVPGSLVETFASANRAAEVLVLCGDLTTHGRADQMRSLIDELKAVDIPIVAVLGNHDHEAGEIDACSAILRARGVHLLDGDHVIVEGIGFVGTKGFCGGFGRGALAPFGEPEIKQFVQVALNEAIKLENALRNLAAEVRVVVLHYAPILETVQGEPEPILPFLGSSRLLQPIETIGADVIFHGHAHQGSLQGKTPAGIPVYNAAQPLLRRNNLAFVSWSAVAPDRRVRELRPAG
ncbi:MAG: metallophosphoesterase family protein [Longimicrobiales bacterium]